MNVEKNVPDIRFEGFSGDWDINSVGMLCDFIVPGRTKPQIFNGDIPWVTTPDITFNCVSKSKIGLAISKEEAKRVGAKIVPKNSIIISCVGDLGLVTKADNELIINQQLHAFIPRESINNWFLLYELLTRKKHMENVATKTAVPYMNKDNCNSIPIAYPPYVEQTKIGNAFQKLDRLIKQHQQKHGKFSSIKKAMLEKMFPKQGESTPEIRFKGFSGKWEKKILGTDVAEIIGGGTPSTSISEFWGGNVDWYSPTEIGRDVYAEGSQKKITDLGLKSSSAKILPAGNTVLFTSRAGIGDMAILAKPGATNQGFQSFVVKEWVSPYFLYSAGKQIKEFALKHASGSTFLEISGKQLGLMEILMPNKDEQTKIGNYFQKLDALINQHQQQITKLNNIKQACLSKMFV